MPNSLSADLRHCARKTAQCLIGEPAAEPIRHLQRKSALRSGWLPTEGTLDVKDEAKAVPRSTLGAAFVLWTHCDTIDALRAL
jgi:hypothetical protein